MKTETPSTTCRRAFAIFAALFVSYAYFYQAGVASPYVMAANAAAQPPNPKRWASRKTSAPVSAVGSADVASVATHDSSAMPCFESGSPTKGHAAITAGSAVNDAPGALSQ